MPDVEGGVRGAGRTAHAVTFSATGAYQLQSGPSPNAKRYGYQMLAVSGPSPTLERKKYGYQIVAGYVQFDVRVVQANNPVGPQPNTAMEKPSSDRFQGPGVLKAVWREFCFWVPRNCLRIGLRG